MRHFWILLAVVTVITTSAFGAENNRCVLSLNYGFGGARHQINGHSVTATRFGITWQKSGYFWAGRVTILDHISLRNPQNGESVKGNLGDTGVLFGLPAALGPRVHLSFAAGLGIAHGISEITDTYVTGYGYGQIPEFAERRVVRKFSVLSSLYDIGLTFSPTNHVDLALNFFANINSENRFWGLGAGLNYGI